MKDKDNNDIVLETLSAPYNEADFTTNRWGYKQTGVGEEGEYLLFTTNIPLLSSTLPTNKDDTTLTFAAKVDITKPAGTYSLDLVFVAVTNMIPGVQTIIFNPNAPEDEVTGTMANQQIEMGQSSTIVNNTYTKTGDWKFGGWNTEANGAGTIYQSGDIYSTTLTTENKTLTLYAQWVPLYMQDFNLAHCKQAAGSNQFTILDRRDEISYNVRHINGGCWMVENLALGASAKNSATVVSRNLSSSDTDITGNYTTSTISLTNWGSYTEAHVTCSAEPGIGCWYNYCAASAGTNCQNQVNIPEASAQSICPSGWKFPTYSEFNNIISFRSDLSLVAGGVYDYDGTIIHPDTHGLWWSSTPDTGFAYPGYVQYSLGYNSVTLSVYGNGTKRSGFYARCIRTS